MLFSIIIPAHNEEKYLPVCIEYIKKQQGNFAYEIIVVDNNSTDSTFEIAKSLGVKVIEEKRQGVGQARKTGTDLAQGKYIINIDADTRLPEDYLLQVDRRFREDSGLVCVGGQFYFYDANLFWCLIRPFLFNFFYVLSWLALRRSISPAGNNMAFRKNIYDKTIGFDPDFKYGEENDLTTKLREFGKTKLDMSLKCFVSSRRLNLFDKDFWVYSLNLVWIACIGRPFKNELKPLKK